MTYKYLKSHEADSIYNWNNSLFLITLLLNVFDSYKTNI